MAGEAESKDGAPRALILHDGNFNRVPQVRDDRVIRCLDFGDVNGLNETWKEIRILLSDGYYLQGLRAFLESCGSTRKLVMTIDSVVPITTLHPPVGLVGGRQIIDIQRKQTEEQTDLLVRLRRSAPAWSILSSCTSGLSQSFIPFNDARIGLPPGFNPGWFGLNSNALSSHIDFDSIDPKNPGTNPFFDIEITVRDDSNDGRDVATIEQNFRAHRFIDYTETRGGHASLIPPFEQRLYNPIGVMREPEEGLAFIHPVGETHLGVSDIQGNLVGRSDGGLELNLLEQLRKYRGVVDLGSAHRSPAARAQFLYQTLASGIPVIAADAQRALSGLLTDEALAAICETESLLVDSAAREKLIFTQVRAAHRSLPLLMARIRGDRVVPVDDRSVSVVISTKRPDYVERAVRNYLGQGWQDKELLLGFHGFTYAELEPRVQDLVSQHSRHIEFADDTIFGEVLRTLTLAADGRIIAKMDDDDWYSPNHLEDLVYGLSYSGSQIVGSGVQFVYLRTADMTVRRLESIGYQYGGHPGGPTIMAPRGVILDSGNWPRVRRAVDTGLVRAIERIGGSVFRSHPHNFLFNYREVGHTWHTSNEYFIAGASETRPGLVPPAGFDGTSLQRAD